VKSRLLLDVVVRKSAAILELLAGEDQTLLVRGNALLVWRMSKKKSRKPQNGPHTLDLGLDIVDGVAALNLEGYCLARTARDQLLSRE
jgi:hypothetical protein